MQKNTKKTITKEDIKIQEILYI